MNLLIKTHEKAGPYFEKKFILPSQNGPRVKVYLNHYFITPKAYARGKNVTIYYDTQNLDCYRQGLNGNRKKQKIRLRQYETANEGPSFAIECKERDGYSVKKRRLRFENPSGDWSYELPTLVSSLDQKSASSLLDGFEGDHERLFPRLTLSYERARYICPHSNLRVNIDWNICSTIVFPERYSRVPSLEVLPFMVLEIKSEQNPSLPPELSSLGTERATLSKYGSLVERNMRWFQAT